MCKSIDGLAAIVIEYFDLDPFSPCLFVFCNRKRDKLKILQWEVNGFWLYYRLLEKGTFQSKRKTNSPHLFLLICSQYGRQRNNKNSLLRYWRHFLCLKEEVNILDERIDAVLRVIEDWNTVISI